MSTPDRSPGTLRVATPDDHEIELTRVFDAPRALVWRTFTEPALVRRWLTGPPGHSMASCEIDLSVGGRWRYVWRMSDGAEIGASGSYRELVAPERIVHTEAFDPWPDNQSLVTTTFAEEGGRTTMVMVARYDSKETRDVVLASGMEDGFGNSCDNLDELLDETASASA